MTLDPSITMGAVINAAVLLIGFVVAFARIGGRIDLLSQRMEAVETAVKAGTDTDKRISILEERLGNHVKMLTTSQRDISDMRRGEGFITGHRKSVDGEYDK